MTAKTKPAVNPLFVMIIGVLGVSFSAILVRSTGAPPAIIAFYRLLFSCILLFPLAVSGFSEIKALGRRELWLCMLGGFFLAFHFIFWFTSLGFTSVSSSTLLVNLHPLVVVTACWLFFGEKLHRWALPGTVVAVTGIALLGWGDLQLTGDALIGDLYALAGAVMVAGYYLVGRHVRPLLSIAPYALLVYGASTIVLLVYNLLLDNPLTGYAGNDWVIFVALAVIPTIFGHTLLNWALRYVSASAVSISVLAEPVLATLLAIPFLAEIPGPLQIAGGLLVLLGIWLFLHRRR